jgi:hypothetical protein
MRNPSLPTDQAKDFAAAKTLRARIGHQSRQNLADTLRSETAIRRLNFTPPPDGLAMASLKTCCPPGEHGSSRLSSSCNEKCYARGQGHALFAKFLTDTEVAQASVDYYKQPH